MAKLDAIKRCVVYTRFSPRPKGKLVDCASIETQIDYCRKWAEANKVEIAEEHREPERSGDDENRPILWSAINSLRPGWGLLVYRLDRLSRDAFLFSCIEREVELKKRAKILSTTGEGTGGSTDSDWFTRQLLALVYEMERRCISARTKAAMLRHQSNGRAMSRRLPYGWMEDPESPLHKVSRRPTGMMPCAEERENIDAIMAYRATGMREYRICRALEEVGRLCRGRKRWHKNLVKVIMAREIEKHPELDCGPDPPQSRQASPHHSFSE